MNHFPLENGSGEFTTFVAPYLGRVPDEEIRTQEDFYKYVEVKGFIINGKPSFNHTSPENAAAFAQRWMYFGLLSFFLFLQDMKPDESSFVTKSTAGDEIVNSAILPFYLDAWTHRERKRGNDDASRVTRFDTLKEALSLVRKMIIISMKQCPAEINTIIMTTVQSLAYSITITMKARFPTFFSGFHSTFGSTNVFINQLLQSSWCIHDVTTLREDFCVDSHHYCTFLKPPRQSVSHASCSTYKCTAMNIDEATYQTQHASSGCTCNFLHVPLENLHKLVEQLRVPLVRYIRPDIETPGGSIEIVERKEGDRHVVFSHVWADGLGNARWQNALPMCQLDRVQKIADMAFEDELSGPVPFYIDTLCVPTDTTFRKLAIRMMRNVYKAATRVVVLDRDIESLPIRADLTTVVVTIHFSGWMRRLWTYHEAALNEALYFKRSDHLLPLSIIKTWANSYVFNKDELWSRPPTVWAVARSILSLLMVTFQVSDLTRVPRPLTIAALCDAFSRRSTSRTEDEAIVIATFMGLEVESVLDADGPEKMKRVLHNAQKVPVALALLSGDRMHEYGYCWAPKSVLGRNQFTRSDPLSRWYSTMLRLNDGQFANFTKEINVGQVLESGSLRFKSPGFAILPCGEPEEAISTTFWATEFARMHDDGVTPMASGFWRTSFVGDVSGMPNPLPQKLFFIVALEDPRQHATPLTFISAFIAIPDEETHTRANKKFYGDELRSQTLRCRFYCRVDMYLVENLMLIRREDWRRELFADGQEDVFHVHLAKPIKEAEWILS